MGSWSLLGGGHTKATPPAKTKEKAKDIEAVIRSYSESQCMMYLCCLDKTSSQTVSSQYSLKKVPYQASASRRG